VTDRRQNGTASKAPASSTGSGLRADHLSVGYGTAPIVQEITLDLRKGQALALVGMNGSGKSTLLKTIVGLLSALQGKLEVLGARPGGTPSRVGYLSQFQSTGFVLPLQAVDVVQMGRFAARGLLGRLKAEDHDLVAESMRRMAVLGLRHMPVRALSGGQQQRVYLAQVLARRADLLVLDEPTASLDAAGRTLFARAVEEELARGASVVMATHDIREAARCSQVMLMARRVVASGVPGEVMTPEALLETFGIILMPQDHGLPVVLESEHGHD
jgi:ABC-type Mn2+/Zn2+ transport system ATPase subunit